MKPQILQVSSVAQPGLVQPSSFFAFFSWQTFLPATRLQHVLLAPNRTGFTIPEKVDRKTMQHNNETAKNFMALKYNYFLGI
jgi:hypothetical protein